MPIHGSEAVSGAVTEVVESRYDLVSSRSYVKTARKLDATSKGDQDIRKVSRELDIDALVHGEFVKRAKNKYELRLSLRAGSSGEEFDSVSVKLRSKRLSDHDRATIRKMLYKALSEVDSWREEPAENEVTASRSRRTRGSNSAERKRARKLRKQVQDKEMRIEEERLARSGRKSEQRNSKFNRHDEDGESRDRRDGVGKDRDRGSSKRSRGASSKSDTKKSEHVKGDERVKDENGRRSKSTKETHKKQEERASEVSTVRDSEGQALDDENPF